MGLSTTMNQETLADSDCSDVSPTRPRRVSHPHYLGRERTYRARAWVTVVVGARREKKNERERNALRTFTPRGRPSRVAACPVCPACLSHPTLPYRTIQYPCAACVRLRIPLPNPVVSQIPTLPSLPRHHWPSTAGSPNTRLSKSRDASYPRGSRGAHPRPRSVVSPRFCEFAGAAPWDSPGTGDLPFPALP